jgi:large subunit ribosomal protein L5
MAEAKVKIRNPSNLMRKIKIAKVTLNVGAGKDQAKLERALKLLTIVSGKTPVKTVTQKRLAAWGLRPGLPIGCKVTLRGNDAKRVLKQLLGAKDGKLSASQFDGYGNVSFGIHEYIDIPGVEYHPELGIIGLQACATLERPGFRLKRRSIRPKKLNARHFITKEEAIEFMKKEFNISLAEEE